MKKASELISIIALVAVIGFSFAACNGGGYSGDEDENVAQTDNGGKMPDGEKTPDGQTQDDGGELGPHNEVSGNTLTAQLEWLKDNVQSNKDYTLTARADETVSGDYLQFPDKSNITITLMSSGGEKTISSLSGTSGFYIGSGVTLILDENITFQNVSFLPIEGGALVMNDGSKIIGAGGVTVYKDGTFTMNGGTITGSVNNGVLLYQEGAAFTMNGGIISGNTYGGVILASGTTFTMNGGKISGNTGSNGGVALLFNKTTFTMNGGEISDNTGGGVNAAGEDCSFIMNNGKISGNTAYTGGGVCVSGKAIFTMNSGEISANKAYATGDIGFGGGVWVNTTATFRISNGIIYGSDAGAEKANTAATVLYTSGGSTVPAGASLFCDGIALYGTGSTWTNLPLISNVNGGKGYIMNTTINVVNGALQ